MPLYSISRDELSGERYLDVDFVWHILSVIEGVQSSKGPSVKIFGIDSASGVCYSPGWSILKSL